MSTHPKKELLRFAQILIAAVAFGSPASVRAQHEGDIFIRSTEPGGGVLATAFDFGPPIPVFESLCVGGFCVYSSTDPGFISPESGSAGLHALDDGTPVNMEIVSIDDAASVKIGTAVIDAPGESAALGTALALHRHPSWQVQVPEGTLGEFEIVFKFTTTSGRYGESVPFAIRLSNLGDANTTSTTLESTTSTTTSSTSMTSATASSTTITSTTLIVTTTTIASAVECGDANDDGAVSATDALVVLRVAVGIDTCAACVCDVDASGGESAVTAADALRVLRAAVGEPGAALLCSPCI